MTGFRLPTGGRIDRSRPIDFRFDGRTYSGFAGDTLASALLANGVRLVGRSFKYHRPRGIVGWGVEEPNALVTIGEGAAAVPNLQATIVDLVPGLVARSQNRWPSLGFDLMAATGLLARFLGAGFYYKTFMGPTCGAWMAYEPHIRRAAGLGKASREPDPAAYEIVHEHTDVLVVGAGPAGMAAANAASNFNIDVMLVEQYGHLGGILTAPRQVRGAADSIHRAARRTNARDVIESLREFVLAKDNLRIHTHCTAFGIYDGNVVGAVERDGNHIKRLLIIRAKKIILATGVIEHPIIFENNDLPGVMLCSALRMYLHYHAAAPGKRIVVYTSNASGYAAALDAAEHGLEVFLIDPNGSLHSRHDGIEKRWGVPPDRQEMEHAGVKFLDGVKIVRAIGRRKLKGIVVSDGAEKTKIICDAIATSGFLHPQLQLSTHFGVKPKFNEDANTFLPGELPDDYYNVGSVTGGLDLYEQIYCAERCSSHAARSLGAEITANGTRLSHDIIDRSANIRPVVSKQMPPGLPERITGFVFVDFQNDVTAKDIEQAVREGYARPEHAKRYTTLGMATDQGRTSNINALALIAKSKNEPFGQELPTTFRPPYTPLTLGALAGRNVGRNKLPERLTPMDGWHRANGARMMETGLWMRPWFYRWAGSEVSEAYVNEMIQVRERCGIADISTLGKIDVVGPDAAEFLNRVYVNGWKGLAVGRARYGVMLREDGLVFDDGTTSRLAEDRYFMTTTTANAAPVLNHLEFYLEAVWSDLKVHVTSVSDQWAAMAVAGPRSRDVLAAAFPGLDVSHAALPHMGVHEGMAEGIDLRILRLSFSGERAYEVYTPAGFGLTVWERLIAAGEPVGLKPYGIEAMGGLRIEKGHVAGPELDGRTALADLGLGRMASTRKRYVGDAMATRPHLTDAKRPRLVGLDPVDPARRPRGGAILFFEDDVISGHGRGHVTSVTYSPTLGRHVALGLIEGGLEAHGRIAVASYPVKDEYALVRIVDPVFLDKEGARLAD